MVSRDTEQGRKRADVLKGNKLFFGSDCFMKSIANNLRLELSTLLEAATIDLNYMNLST